MLLIHIARMRVWTRTCRWYSTVNVVYEDNHLLVVNKPSGILSQGDGTNRPNLLDWGKDYIKEKYCKPGKAYLGLVHRLDFSVSGLMVFGRTSKASSRLSKFFRQHDGSLVKEYLAVVAGSGLGELKATKTFREYAMEIDGRAAVTGLLPVSVGDDSALVRLRLITGRKHQLRQLLAAMDLPIIGDDKYGSAEVLDGTSIALHCNYLSFPHTTSMEQLSFHAPLPLLWQNQSWWSKICNDLE